MTTLEKKALTEKQLASGLVETAVFGGTGLLLLSGLLVGERHWAGALHNPLPIAALCGLGAGLAAAAAALRGLGLRLQAGRSSLPRRLLFSAGISVALLCFGWALTPPGTSAAGRSFFWLLLLAEETWGWTTFRKSGKTGTQRVSRDGLPTASQKLAASPLLSAPVALPEEVPRPEVMQHLTRRKSAAGEEELAGWVRMPVAAGQRNGNVHVAFCPPFSRTPELAVEQVDGPEARIKTAQLFPYGVRLDLKLAVAATQPDNVLLSFSAKTSSHETHPPAL
ncbi:MAG: hypothetical protein JXB10_04525 [Pirellulales bacterium]|nr:hypothetical protein [Pirellulales bacterium]